MINKEEILEFVVEAHRQGYASGAAAPSRKEPDGSTTVEHEAGLWKMHDNYFGGEPFGGREVAFYQGKAVWMMVYYGRVTGEGYDAGEVYQFLMAALSQVPAEAPFRGPHSFQQGNLEYVNDWQGEVEAFAGRESIRTAGNEIYLAHYCGGLVDQQ